MKIKSCIILMLGLIVFCMTFLTPNLSNSQDNSFKGESTNKDDAITEDKRIQLITSRIRDINDRLNNPSSTQAEKDMLKKERDLLTEILMKYLVSSTRSK